MCCDLSSRWFWNRKSSPSRRPSSGAPCPCSGSWPWPRATTPACRPWPRSSWRTCVPWSSTMRRGTWRVPSPPRSPLSSILKPSPLPCVTDGQLCLARDEREFGMCLHTSSGLVLPGEPEKESMRLRGAPAVPGRGLSGPATGGAFPRPVGTPLIPPNGRFSYHLLHRSALF